MTAQTAQQVNGVLQDPPAKAPALMAHTTWQERSFLMSMGALPAKLQLARATLRLSLLVRTAL